MGMRYDIDALLPDPGGDDRRAAFLQDLWVQGFTTGTTTSRRDDNYEEECRRWEAFRSSYPDLDLPERVPVIQARAFRGETYWGQMHRRDSEDSVPYPELLGDGLRFSISFRVPTPPEWYVVFGAEDREVDEARAEVLVPIASARRHAGIQFRKLRYVPYDMSRHTKDFERAAPNGSEEWKALRKALSLFDVARYVEVVEFLAMDLGPEALLKLNYREELPGMFEDGPTPEDHALFHERVRFVNRVLDRLAQRDFAALLDEPLLADRETHPSDFLGLLLLEGEPPPELREYLLDERERDYSEAFELVDRWNGRLHAGAHARLVAEGRAPAPRDEPDV